MGGSVTNHLAFHRFSEVFSGTVMYSPTILSWSYRYTPPTTLEPPPPFFFSQNRCLKRLKCGRIPKSALQKWIKIEMCKMVFGWRLHRLSAQNSNRSLKKV